MMTTATVCGQRLATERSQSVHRDPRLGVDQVDHGPIDRLDAVRDGGRGDRDWSHRDVCPSLTVGGPVVRRPGGIRSDPVQPRRSPLRPAGHRRAWHTGDQRGVQHGEHPSDHLGRARRWLVLVAKVAVFGIVTLIVGENRLVRGVLPRSTNPQWKAPTAMLADPGVLRAVFTSGVYLLALGLLAFGLASIIRVTAAAISTFIGILFKCRSSPTCCLRPSPVTSGGFCRPTSAPS